MIRKMDIKIAFIAMLLAVLPGGLSYGDGNYSRDRDHDGFPDRLESETGYNPDVNESLEKSTKGGKCGVLKTDPVKLTRPDNVLIILDISGSMSTPLGGSTRMELARKILKNYIDALPESMKVGLVIYGKTGCDENSVEVMSPITASGRGSLREKIDSLGPRGQTPIAMTLRKVPEFFKGMENENNNLILISDGMESCGGDPVKEIIDLKESVIDPEVTVIGLGVDSRTKGQLSKIARASGGVYSDVKNEKDFVKAFENFFNKLSGLYKDVVCIVQQYNTYLSFETQQYNKSKAWLIRAKLKVAGGDASEIDALGKELDKNHEDRINARDNLEKMVKNKTEDMAKAIKNFIRE